MSRASTPAPSDVEDDDRDVDSHDSEEELEELNKRENSTASAGAASPVKFETWAMKYESWTRVCL